MWSKMCVLSGENSLSRSDLKFKFKLNNTEFQAQVKLVCGYGLICQKLTLSTIKLVLKKCIVVKEMQR